MKLEQLYQSNKPDISIELFPPKTPQGLEALWKQVDRLRLFDPAFFSVTYGAAGSTRDLTLDLVDQLKNRLALETVCHLTVVGQSKEEIHSNLEFLRDKEIPNIMALRGDPPKGEKEFSAHADGFHYAADLVEAAASYHYFSIAVAGFPELHPESPDRRSDIAYLKKKVDAGASVIVTQLFFDNAHFYEFHDAARKAGIKVPIVPGILPILSRDQVQRFTAICKSTIPDKVSARLERLKEDEAAATEYGIELATEQAQGLLDFGCPGLHFYSLNKSGSVEVVLKNLGLAV
ncbi:MAG: methylenetetrahydrofolate reductase [NAD(P)H] [Candidatus Omnitrophica bacterium]|nr:methylenetetrahydrofolate reductase [NAD(P)H] [Candidatus Omnitrophota bacterium]